MPTQVLIQNRTRTALGIIGTIIPPWEARFFTEEEAEIYNAEITALKNSRSITVKRVDPDYPGAVGLGASYVYDSRIPLITISQADVHPHATERIDLSPWIPVNTSYVTIAANVGGCGALTLEGVGENGNKWRSPLIQGHTVSGENSHTYRPTYTEIRVPVDSSRVIWYRLEVYECQATLALTLVGWDRQ